MIGKQILKNFNILLGLMLALLVSGCSTSLQKNTNMAFIPGGPFTMGFEIENDNEWGDLDEDPVHEVTLSPYWMDKYEVTSSDFAEFLNSHKDSAERYIDITPNVTVEIIEGKYQPRTGLDNFPVNRVSWYGADAYCRWQDKRLPTEAEWEKAARGTDQRIFPWGNEFPNNERVTFRRKFSKIGFKVLEPVNSMDQGVSPYGIHHMAGNVWEWVADWFDGGTYEDREPKDPQGPDTGISKVLRGGNWYYKAYYMRTTYRFNERPGQFNIWQGFRCAH
ncbi:MAG: formylglycine-generating enzyme family protein [Nitrospina sp.]|jgi:formylglycine-generating enzyme required for sulfatase activity|nr:formylglycine-generating enzyme family protein [Nitrospina sp.]